MDSGRKARILIVDDIAKNIQAIANILKLDDYQMSFARDGTTALSILASEPFDLVLLDVMMPEMDGFEVCQKIKQMDRTRNIPVIFLTAKTDSESLVKGFDCGAVDYVTKPFTSAELLARVRTHLRLKQANKTLRDLNATKDKFFSIIAHDLRNPFNVLIGYTDLLTQCFDDLDKQRIMDILDKIKKTLHFSLSLMENLLKWAQCQTGHLILHPTRLDLYAISLDCLMLHQASAGAKQIAIHNEITQESYVFCDENMIQTVLRNLVSNAIKFTHPGGDIFLASKPVGNCMEISVSDTGIGICSEDLDKLFKLDEKIISAGTADEKGTGLGLILCREFIKKSGGNLQVQSQPDKGTCFRFTLPMDKDPSNIHQSCPSQ